MPSLFSIFVDLKANVADFVSGMSGASYAAKKTGRDIQDSFSSLGNLAQKALAPLGEVGQAIGSSLAGIAEMAGKAGSSLANLGGVSVGGAIAGIATASVAAAAGMAVLAVKGSEVVESFERISQKTGISISDLQTFGAAGQSVGVSLDDVVTGMRKFDQVLTGTGRGTSVLQNTLKSLGITAKDNKTALLQLADAFQAMPDGAEKDATAVELLGRSGLNLIPVLDKGRAGIEQFEGIVSEFGPSITANAIAATDAWKISILELSEAWQKTQVDAEKALLPLFSWLTEKIAVAISEWDNLGEHAKNAFLLLNENIPTGGAAGIAGVAKMWLNPQLPEQGFTQQQRAQIGASAAGGSLATSEYQQRSDQLRSTYELLAAGGKEQLALKQAQAQLASDVSKEKWGEAAADQKEIDSLKQIMALEQARAQIWAEIERKGNFSHPTLSKDSSLRLRPDQLKALTEEQTKALPTFAQLGEGVTPEQATANQQPGLQAAAAAASLKDAQDQVAGFWAQFGNEASNTFEQIGEQYDTDYANFYDLLAQKKISQEDFDAISVQLEANRIESIAKLYQAQGEEAKKLNESVIGDPFASIGSKFKAMANQISIEGQGLGPKVFSSMSKAVDDISGQIAKLLVTGKANFRELFDSLAESIVKSQLQSTFGQIAKMATGKGGLPGSSANAPGGTPGIVSGSLGIAGTIGKIFGIGGGSGAGAAPDGSQANPFYTVPVDASGNAIGSLSGKGFQFGGLNKLFGGSSDNSDSGDSDSGSGLGGLSSLGGGLKNLWGDAVSGVEKVGSSIGSFFGNLFGGGLAGGGDMDPGKAYLVGEHGPELMFAGSRGGSIAPITKSSGGHTVNNQITVVTKDADSFGKSSGQIMAQFHRATQTALARNG